MAIDAALYEARKAICGSDVLGADDAELRLLRDSVRALIQAVEELNEKLHAITTTNNLWDGS
jgi:hypothetical protein